ncbi:PLC-like phosphodiesterase [Fusarium solani]|uniref:Phosphoinositide phospholipase C n=1 Tax=Fusarium solani TaxID=169388 RepID=A0A9P9GS89_FUSSL|nr:PLC-like phosphodiesterase [Fusarium solani]KAH7243842.1 PLC-like phosphodiesterase [Fusarium solani]
MSRLTAGMATLGSPSKHHGQYYKEAFGSRLVTETLEDCYDKLPSPSELIERILIKPQLTLTRSVTDAAMLMPSQSLPQSPCIALALLVVDRASDNDSGGERNSRKTSTKIVKELGDLGVIVPLHNLRYMMRVYPNRTRITSNNFDPLLYWRRGIQMINRAMFNGSQDFSGYVLKPAELRDIQKERSVVSFTIDVISAQRLMRPVSLPANKAMNPYVEVEVFHASDKREKRNESTLPRDLDPPQKFRTNIVRENGFNPMFDDHFKFKVTKKQPDLVFVRWSVKLSNDGENYNDRPAVATYTAKLSNLKQGYRTLSLLNDAGDQYLFSTLFCKIKIDSIEKMMIDAPHRALDGSRIKGLGGKAFS